MPPNESPGASFGPAMQPSFQRAMARAEPAPPRERLADYTRGLERGHPRQNGVELFNLLDLARECAILARAVRVLVMQKEEIEFVPVLFQNVDLFAQALRLPDDLHPDQPGQPFVHWIDRDRRGF